MREGGRGREEREDVLRAERKTGVSGGIRGAQDALCLCSQDRPEITYVRWAPYGVNGVAEGSKVIWRIIFKDKVGADPCPPLP